MTFPVLTNNIALHDMAARILPQHEADEGALTAAQFEQIKELELQGKRHSVRSSLFKLKTTESKR